MKGRRGAAPAPALQRPLVIAAVGQKGGSGKSTLTSTLGDCALARGYRVLFVDADPQHTLTMWAAAAAEARQVRRVLSSLEPHREAEKFPGHDLVLIDSPGRLDVTQRSALLVADLAIVPAVPSPADLWALKDSVDLVRTAQQLRPAGALQLGLVLNRVTRSLIARQTGELIRGAATRKGIPVLRGELGQRTAYVEGLARGTGPVTLEPSGAAGREVAQVFDEVLGLCLQGGRDAQLPT